GAFLFLHAASAALYFLFGARIDHSQIPRGRHKFLHANARIIELDRRLFIVAGPHRLDHTPQSQARMHYALTNRMHRRGRTGVPTRKRDDFAADARRKFSVGWWRSSRSRRAIRRLWGRAIVQPTGD